MAENATGTHKAVLYEKAISCFINQYNAARKDTAAKGAFECYKAAAEVYIEAAAKTAAPKEKQIFFARAGALLAQSEDMANKGGVKDFRIPTSSPVP